MPAIRFTDTQGHEDLVALGLPASRLALVGAGLAGTLAIFNLPLAEGWRGLLGAGLLLGTAALAWLRIEGQPLTVWAIRAMRFGLRRRAARSGFGGEWVGTDGAGGCGEEA